MPTRKGYPGSIKGGTEHTQRKVFHEKASSVHSRSHMKCSAILVGIKELCRLYLIHDKITQGHTFLRRRNVG